MARVVLIENVALLYPVSVHFTQVLPASSLYCHWYFMPVPHASTVNFAFSPTAAFFAAGCATIAGLTPDTVSLAPFDLVLPTEFFTTQRYRLPLFFSLPLTFRLALVLSLIFFQVSPLSLEICH